MNGWHYGRLSKGDKVRLLTNGLRAFVYAADPIRGSVEVTFVREDVRKPGLSMVVHETEVELINRFYTRNFEDSPEWLQNRR